jgi:prepilin-type N-terminal cleavage/methylation domain-containing protein
MLRKMKKGLTMPEILIVVAIVALLAAGLLFVSNKAKSQADTQLVQDTLTLLDTALQQYYDQTHSYPPDVNFTSRSIQTALSTTASPSVTNPDEYLSAEVLYYYLNRVPASRAVLQKIDQKLITCKGGTGAPSDPDITIYVDADGKTVNLLRIVDVWNTPLEYVRLPDAFNPNVQGTNFPLIRSAGPNKVFETPGTGDDIINKKN